MSTPEDTDVFGNPPPNGKTPQELDAEAGYELDNPPHPPQGAAPLPRHTHSPTPFLPPNPTAVLHDIPQVTNWKNLRVNMYVPLSDFLRRIKLPRPPPMHRADAARTTGDPLRSKAARGDPAQPKRTGPGVQKTFPKLDKVVYYPDLVNQLLGPARDLLDIAEVAVNLDLDPGTRDEHFWMTKVHPVWTTADLTHKIYSEKDTEDWVMSALLLPIVRCIRTLQAGGVIQRDYPPESCSASSSKGGQYPIPDAVILVDGKIKATVEVKTHNALRARSVFLRNGTFSSVMTSPDDHEVPRTLAMKFHYPKERPPSPQERPLETKPKPKEKSPTVSSQTKIIIQVYEQMCDANVDFAILTSFEVIIFFYKEGNTLYMSEEVTRDNMPILMSFAFVACAIGRLDRTKVLNVPRGQELDTSWWTEEVKENKGGYAGIHPMCMPGAYKEAVRERARREEEERKAAQAKKKDAERASGAATSQRQVAVQRAREAKKAAEAQPVDERPVGMRTRMKIVRQPPEPGARRRPPAQ